MWRTMFLALFAIKFSCFWRLCIADYKLEIRAVTYSNPSKRDYNGDCCDVGFLSCGNCDVDFFFCVRSKGTSALSNTCWYSAETSDDKSDTSTINFPSSGELYSNAGLSNPITFVRSGSWPGSFQLMVRITDSDGSTSDDLVDRVTFDLNLSPSSSFSSTINGVKRYNRASFSAQFRVRCSSYYYTSSCSVYCKPRDDSSGHYDCNSSGQKVCKSGWSDPSNNCLTPICKSGCSEEGGYCNQPNECICNSGWTGSLCNQCIPKEGCSSEHGHCDGPFTCVCESGYGGPLCTQDADVCNHQSPCTNGATCTNTGLDSYSCSCLPGYTGVNCQTDINECETNPCQNEATCYDQVNGYICECVPGYTGSNCETEINECDPDPCVNGAVCNDLVNGYNCSCLAGYVGTNCEGHECDSTPCTNNGTCVNTTVGSGYKCDCIAGYEGQHCESDIDECISFIECGNGGTCVNVPGSYQCVCAPGYAGKNCSIDIDDCASSPCPDNSGCVDGIDSYTCICDVGYTGDSCGELINYCGSDPCENGATCNSYIGSFGCNCLDGFNGSRCEEDIDDCISNSCANNGTCQDEVNGFTCICSEGYTGSTCEAEKDYCDPNPCNEGEDCVVAADPLQGDNFLCMVCIDDICEDPAAVVGRGNKTEPPPTSEAVTDNTGMIVGSVIAGIVLLCCCCCGCITCISICKRRSKEEFQEFETLEGHTHISQNPLFISPDMLLSSNSFKSFSKSLKLSSSFKRSSKKKKNKRNNGDTIRADLENSDRSIDNPYNNAELVESNQTTAFVSNPLYSMKSYSRGSSPRPTSPSKHGYVQLDESTELEGNYSIPRFSADNSSATMIEKPAVDSSNVPLAAQQGGGGSGSYMTINTTTTTDNPYVDNPSTNKPLLPPRDSCYNAKLDDNPSLLPSNDNVNHYDSVVTPLPPTAGIYSVIEGISSYEGLTNPYETIPSLENEEEVIYQELPQD